MDENAKKIQREIAKDKIQIILSSIAVAVLVIMELYIMINFKSNFLAMAIGILLMILALFFLISGLLDMSLKQKDMEQEKYEEIYNAQKASYLVIKKSFDEMDHRLRTIEENSSLPAEDIINAQKAVAKVTISRSKENTDALMNSNDELINQLVNIQEKLETNNNQILEKQQTLLKETNFDIQQKIAELTSQISNIEGRIQGGIPVMAAQPVQMAAPVVEAPAPEPVAEPAMEEMPVIEEELPAMDEMPAMEEELPAMDEMPAMEEELPAMDEMPAMEEELPAMDEIPAEEPAAEEELPAMEEAPVDDLGLDLDAVVEEEPVVDDLGLDLDAVVEEEQPAEEPIIEEELPVMEEAPAEEISLEEPIAEEAPVEEIALEEPVAEEAPVEEIALEEPVAEEAPIEIPAEEPVVEEIPAEEPVEISADDPGASLDALLEEIGEVPGEEPEPEPEAAPAPEPEPEPAPADDAVVIPDVGIDLSDPNRVMSPEEIEKLFANI